MHEGVVSARLGLAGIPSITESTLIARDAAIARYEDGRIHIQHLSARESVEAIAEAKARGVQITCEASPHHLTLTDEALLERLDTRLKMNPPLRTEDDRQALIDGLKDGTIDCIATDHAPHAREEKEVPFEEAPMGTTGLETAFAAVYTAKHPAAGADRREAHRRRRADGPADAGDRRRRARRPRADRPRRRVGGGRGRLREPLGELLLRRPRVSRAGSSRRSPPAGSSTASGSWPPYERLRPARRRHALRRRGRRRARLGDRRGRLHDRHVGLPGVDDRPELRAPADHLHDRARRQLRRQRSGDGVRPHPRRRRDHARRGRLRRRAGRRAGLAELAARERHPGHPRRRHARARPPHPLRGRDARRDLPGRRAARARPASASTPSRAWSAATSPAR